VPGADDRAESGDEGPARGPRPGAGTPGADDRAESGDEGPARAPPTPHARQGRHGRDHPSRSDVQDEQLTCWIRACLSVKFAANPGLAVISEREAPDSEQAACWDPGYAGSSRLPSARAAAAR
jgi:hypothetical protein